MLLLSKHYYESATGTEMHTIYYKKPHNHIPDDCSRKDKMNYCTNKRRLSRIRIVRWLGAIIVDL